MVLVLTRENMHEVYDKKFLTEIKNEKRGINFELWGKDLQAITTKPVEEGHSLWIHKKTFQFYMNYEVTDFTDMVKIGEV